MGRHARKPLRDWLAAGGACVLSLTSGCLSPRYQEAPKETPPAVELNVPFPPGPVSGMLHSVITYNGPGSWKRNALWDEYVVTLRNSGRVPLEITAATLADPTGAAIESGTMPWKLEDRSKTLEQKYKDAGLAFARYTAPGLVIAGAGVLAISSAGVLTSAADTAAGATVLALPVYYVSVVTINHLNKVDMEKEFARRRLVLPLTLAPGEDRTGSIFFPLVPNPQSLVIACQRDGRPEETILALDFLHGIHIKSPLALAGGGRAPERSK